MTVHCYLSKQRHILLEEGNVEKHRKVVEKGELQKEREQSLLGFFFPKDDLSGRNREEVFTTKTLEVRCLSKADSSLWFSEGREKRLIEE